MTAKRPSLVSEGSTFLSRFMSFPTPDYGIVCALYSIATHLYLHFDAFPYMHITADTKQAGKTRLSELMGFLCRNPRNFGGATPATIFNSIANEYPTIFLDEIESLVSESASMMRSVLNIGYRQGQTIPRLHKGQVVQMPAYCPKVFIGIGDVYDTLRDRVILLRLRRGQPAERFQRDIVEAEGAELRERFQAACEEHKEAILDAYMRIRLPYLSDRDEELWLPLFSVCTILAPELVPELERIATDMSTDKTATKRRYVDLGESEEDALRHQYSERLLRDIAASMGKATYMLSTDLLDALKAIPTAPWRKFRGDGLTVMDMADLLSRFNLKPRNIRITTQSTTNRVRKGYKRVDVQTALQSLG